MPPGKPPEAPNSVNPNTNTIFVKPAKRPRGRPPKNINQRAEDDTISVDSFASSNVYEDLSDNDPGESISVNKRPRQTKIKLPPPFVVHNITSTQLNSLLSKFPVANNIIRRRLTQYGIKLFVDTVEEYKALRDFLNKSNINYFTYTLDEEKRSKFVLYGLPDMEVEQITEELNKHEFNPVDIRKLKLKKSRYTEHTNYLLYFSKKDKVNVASLRQIKGLFHYVVNWEYYVSKNRGPTQCNRCQSYGHSHSNCKLKQKCMKCSEEHETDKCIYNKETLINGNKVKRCSDDKLLCANCGGKHTAVFKDCQSRINYIQLKQKIAEKTAQNKQIENQKRYTHLRNDLPKNFPLMPGQTPNPSHHQPNPQKSGTPWHKSKDLFTPKQLFGIFNEIIKPSG
uniref:CSON006377 protein n=1 Tax=Culicoides sonorensis TaxID=179676 RepID=A0A336LMN6_CULSO